MMISYQFPLQYVDKYSAEFNEFLYCQLDKYFQHPQYKKTMDRLSQTRTILIDPNGLSDERYLDSLGKFKNPVIYIIDQNDPQACYDFYQKAKKILKTAFPCVEIKGSSLFEMYKFASDSVKLLGPNIFFVVDANTEGLKNPLEEEGYFNATDIDYEPLLMAQNRRIFIKEIIHRFPLCCIYLRGCKCLAEFSAWSTNFDMGSLMGLIASHPIDMIVEGSCNFYDWGFFRHNGRKHPMTEYYPENVPDYFDMDFDALKASSIHRVSFEEDMRRNIEYFGKVVENNTSDMLYYDC